MTVRITAAVVVVAAAADGLSGWETSAPPGFLPHHARLAELMSENVAVTSGAVRSLDMFENQLSSHTPGAADA